MVKKVLDIFTRQYHLPSHVDGDTEELRRTMETTLNSEVLPHLDVTLMSLCAIERNFSEHIYIDNSAAIVPQLIGSFTERTP